MNCNHSWWIARRVTGFTTRATGVLSGVVAITVIVGGAAAAQPRTIDAPIEGICPALYALGVQGPDESSTGIDVTTDSGALGQVFGPLLAVAQGLVQRAYIPYGLGENGAQEPYEQAIETAAGRLEAAAAEVVRRCPNTKVAVAGYTQGAPAVARFAQRVGAGKAVVGADHIAAIALLANPSRAAGAPVIIGRAGASSPDAVPGTRGAEISKIAFSTSAEAGRGVDRIDTTATGYGALTGRVADLCVAGDLTCATPTEGPIATAITNIAAQSDLGDPVTAITTIAESLAATVYKTAVGVVNEDLHGQSLDELSYDPAKSLSQRVAEASDPKTPLPGIDATLAAVLRVGTIAVNAITTVAKKVITPATIAELATVGLANPLAALASLGTKVAGAVVELIPPRTANRWIEDAFEAITTNISDNTELYTLSSATQYSSASGRHGSYSSAPATPAGESAFTGVADWFTAAARDLAATVSVSRTPAPSSPAAAPTSPSPPAPTTTPPPASAPPLPSSSVPIPSSVPARGSAAP
ncbi:cutinase family protein [Nocardia sp. XZ_19_385]|uniref:cutinase family protein n=1 Tax=Nocardia sp. XZ_19_385 TaxID=2769488 RepID=UPI00188F65D6|nr:cutinase family protein [Nocardia sp. XZ_19_385]